MYAEAESRALVSFAAKNIAGYKIAKRFLNEERVSAVVGTGGYASAAAARAAVSRGLPLVLLEQNLVPGRATRWLSRHASLVCISWAQTRSHLRCHRPIVMTGTPLRTEFGTNRIPNSLVGNSFFIGDHLLKKTSEMNSVVGYRGRQLLILGGSGGAESLNKNIPKALHKIRSQLPSWRVIHQTGRHNQEVAKDLYDKLALPVQVVDFIDDMPGMLAKTDLVIGRAGGTTLAELAATGTPALLIPYPNATDEHQLHNAAALEKAKAATLVKEPRGKGRLDDLVADALLPLLARVDRRRAMSASMLRFSRPSATDDVATMILQLVGAVAPQDYPRASA